MLNLLISIVMVRNITRCVDLFFVLSRLNLSSFIEIVFLYFFGQASGLGNEETMDTVITNAVIINYTGIYKADVGITGGNIVGIGKAGNPDTMDIVDWCHCESLTPFY